ncbi:hypothetical protein [Rugamonas sp. DEMB1]|uniref:hypothetical protein n=1 Tax=Rugamonas sp. DEMB1 TaxID=3039386 RepID=UPI00244B8B3D|nr:hypothetical protein [Rugamonas sp. DEMB1]WGG51800.1 hypothetical protein QC826_06155 [Rugamonas sp. DEMB1]
MDSHLSPHAPEMSAAAIARASLRWSAAAATGHSPYLERKQVTAPEVRYEPDGTILVPVFAAGHTAECELAGLQMIQPDGTKRFTQGMYSGGAYLPIGAPKAGHDAIFLTESYATARTIRMATHDTLPGYAAFSAHNLRIVANVVREALPHGFILICADDDSHGVAAAVEAAMAIGNAGVVVPRFKHRGGHRYGDFNRLYVEESLATVELQLTHALASTERQAEVRKQALSYIKRACPPSHLAHSESLQTNRST